MKVMYAVAALIVLAAVAMIPGIRGEDAKTTDAANKVIYVCLDSKNPCFSEKPDGCASCADKVQKKPYKLENLMEVMGKLAGGMKDDIVAGAADKVTAKLVYMKQINAVITDFPPKKNVAKLEEFKSLAANQAVLTGKLEEAAKAADKNALKESYKALSDSCSKCHTTFR